MALHHDLLEQAEHLARREKKKPRQASLRRAVSTAYYALFHMLLDEAARILFPNAPPELRQRGARAFAHGEMKSACQAFVRPTGGITNLTTSPLAQEINSVASALVELQEARHKADYDLTEAFDRVQVLSRVEQARKALNDWRAVRGTPNANVFLAALLVHNKWNK